MDNSVKLVEKLRATSQDDRFVAIGSLVTDLHLNKEQTLMPTLHAHARYRDPDNTNLPDIVIDSTYLQYFPRLRKTFPPIFVGTIEELRKFHQIHRADFAINGIAFQKFIDNVVKNDDDLSIIMEDIFDRLYGEGKYKIKSGLLKLKQP